MHKMLAGRPPAGQDSGGDERTRASARTQKRPGFERKLAYRYFTWKETRAPVQRKPAGVTEGAVGLLSLLGLGPATAMQVQVEVGRCSYTGAVYVHMHARTDVRTS